MRWKSRMARKAMSWKESGQGASLGGRGPPPPMPLGLRARIPNCSFLGHQPR